MTDEKTFCETVIIDFKCLIRLTFERKKLNTSLISSLSVILAVFFVTTCLVSFPLPARADFSLLKESITAYNLENLQKSLSDGSYRGEEGILRIRPEIGRSLGLKVLMDQQYAEATDQFEKADELLEKVEEALTTKEKEKFPGEHVKKVRDLGLDYNMTLRSAQRSMMDYHSKLTPQIDDRLNDRICSKLLEEMLHESFKRASCNLRDSLGLFYNKCQNLDEHNGPLNVENVQFVNTVVHEFKEKATQKALNLFDIDRQKNTSSEDLNPRWKNTLGRGESRYIPLVERILEEQKKAGYPVDLLLFLALIRQESKFNPQAVSHVGAVGLTQIMPRTATGLGMKNVFEPQYFNEAGSFMGRERKLRNRAMKLMKEITEEYNLGLARRARELMQESLKYREKRTKLYARYKKEVLKNGTDDRLDPQKSIEHGFKYFSNMMKQQKGDISLALASYNSGPHRIRQYKGIPPYAETVNFRNRVLKYYRNYLRKLNIYQRGCQEGLENMTFPDDMEVSEMTEIGQKVH
jgi:hypothetical protein